jgi:hypothetical protein
MPATTSPNIIRAKMQLTTKIIVDIPDVTPKKLA